MVVLKEGCCKVTWFHCRFCWIELSLNKNLFFYFRWKSNAVNSLTVEVAATTIQLPLTILATVATFPVAIQLMPSLITQPLQQPQRLHSIANLKSRAAVNWALPMTIMISLQTMGIENTVTDEAIGTNQGKLGVLTRILLE